jgi:chemotaxis protein MotB
MPKLKDEIQQKIRKMSDFDKLKSHIEMTVTAEGLRIELMETSSGSLFDSGSPKLNNQGVEILTTLAQELGKLPNKLSIEGHTDSKPYATTGSYSNWELSTDRANSARRLMQTNGVKADQVTQVRGFADQSLRNHDKPFDPSNRRISLIVQYIPVDKDKDKDNEEPDKNESESEKAAKPSPEGEAKKPEGNAPASSGEEPAKK